MFQLYVVLIAAILTGLFIYLVDYTISKQAVDTKWPAYIPNCPDYWTDYNGDGTKCVSNGYNTTDKCAGTIDFSGTYCQKTTKAMVGCPGMIWDGITYGSGNNFKINKCK